MDRNDRQISIIQLNLHKGRTPMAEILLKGSSEKTSFLLVQEPPTRAGSIAGISGGARFVCKEDREAPPLAAIVTGDQPVMGRASLTSRNIAVATTYGG